MSTIEKRFRRNLVAACIAHAALIGGIFLFEGIINSARSNAPIPIQMITPADILGDRPKGEGIGRGNFAPPPPEPAGEAGSSATSLAADEQPAPKPKATPPAVNNPNDVLIPKKPVPIATKKPVSPEKSSSVKAISTKPATTAKISSVKPAVSADSIRQRFASALAASEGGSPGGDNRTPGGSTGQSKYGRLGSLDGAADGIAGGIGKGSPFWSYYMHVHDRMYEAWEQPGQAVDFDKKLVATILLRIARDGRIDGVRLDRSSGNKLMDDSALGAARSVPRLDPLPQGLGGDYAEISVNFRLEG